MTIEVAREVFRLDKRRKELWQAEADRLGERILHREIDPRELFYEICRRIEEAAATRKQFMGLKVERIARSHITRMFMSFPGSDGTPEMCAYASVQYPTLPLFQNRQPDTVQSIRGSWQERPYQMGNSMDAWEVLGSEVHQRPIPFGVVGRLGIVDDIVSQIESRRRVSQ